MTPQERELISTFLEQMKQTQVGQKDAEAEALIGAAVAGKADASYLLVQRAVGLDYALQAARAELAKAQAELAQLRSGAGSSFVGQGDSWGRSGKSVPTAAAGAQSQAPFTPAFSPSSLGKPAAPAAAAAAPASSWGSGMLGTVATTAAGVVAGSFLFQGIQGLMGHHNSPGETAKAGDAGAASVPPPSLPPEHVAAADSGSNIGLPPEQDDTDSFDDVYADSGDGGDWA
jgi:hypothetical protein